MACNCNKKRIVTQPKKVVKTPPRKPDSKNGDNSTSVIRRIIRKAIR